MKKANLLMLNLWSESFARARSNSSLDLLSFHAMALPSDVESGVKAASLKECVGVWSWPGIREVSGREELGVLFCMATVYLPA